MYYEFIFSYISYIVILSIFSCLLGCGVSIINVSICFLLLRLIRACLMQWRELSPSQVMGLKQPIIICGGKLVLVYPLFRPRSSEFCGIEYALIVIKVEYISLMTFNY